MCRTARNSASACLGPGHCQNARVRKIEAERGRGFRTPNRVAEGHAPGMAAGEENRDAQDADRESADRRSCATACKLAPRRRAMAMISAAKNAMLASVTASPPQAPK